MANNQKDVLIKFNGSAAGVKAAVADVKGELTRLTGHVQSAGKALKAGLGLAVGQELKEFLKSTFTEATKAAPTVVGTSAISCTGPGGLISAAIGSAFPSSAINPYVCATVGTLGPLFVRR